MQYGLHFKRDILLRQPNPMKYLIDLCVELEDLGYDYFENGDHLSRSFDSPTVMAAIISHTGRMRLTSSIFHLVPRGLLPMAKFYASVDVLSEGRVSAGVGLGSAFVDWELMGFPREEMTPRFEEAIQALRALLHPGSDPFVGKFYNTESIDLVPQPFQQGGIPVHVGSWGSKAGLRRAARFADGWRGSSRHTQTNPERFSGYVAQVNEFLREYGRDPGTFSHGITNIDLFISEDRDEIERHGGPPFVADREGATGARQPHAGLEDEVPWDHTMVGTRAECVEKLRRWQASGCQAIAFSPRGPDIHEQLRIFMTDVVPAVIP